MQFFEHQDRARGRTSLLIGLFLLAVVALVGSSTAVSYWLLTLELKPGEAASPEVVELSLTAGAVTLGIIFFGTLYRVIQLRAGGKKVAETLGGVPILPTTSDLLERRVVNVVEEMSIAAGLPVPPVYLLPAEKGINAFAAGWSPDDVVIGITRGAIEQLNRDQLQGVIAHEFSHILNRDCALNMRLLGVLHGILVISIIGRVLIRFGSTSRSSSRNNPALQLALLGAVVWLFGSIGVLIGNLIQSAISRQREYLADASAVQFTRNPEGIAGALATIGTSTSALASPRGSETSHMLIGEPTSRASFFGMASHPPLFDRIQRVLPSWKGDFAQLATPPGSVLKSLERATASGEKAEEEAPLDGVLPMGTGLLEGEIPREASLAAEAFLLDAINPQEPGTPVAQARTLLDRIPPSLREAAQSPFSSRALLLSMILEEDPERRAAALALISQDAPLAAEVQRLAAHFTALDQELILPLFDIAVGALSGLSAPQAAQFLNHVQSVAAQISSRNFRAYCLSEVIARHAGRDQKKAKGGPVLVKEAIETVLGVLAQEGHTTREEAERAFSDGAGQLGPRGKALVMPQEGVLTVEQLDRSFHALFTLPTVRRQDLLSAAESVASFDGVMAPQEAELLRVMATSLNVAAPPVFASAAAVPNSGHS